MRASSIGVRAAGRSIVSDLHGASRRRFRKGESMRKVLVPALLLGVFFTASARAQTTPTFTANLLGINEAPAAFDPKAAGFAYVTIDPTTGTVTYDLTAPSL